MARHMKSCRNKKYELSCTQDMVEMETAAEARPLPAGEGQGRQMGGKAKTTHEGAGDDKAVAEDAREEASEGDRVRRLQERKQRAIVTEHAQALREEVDAAARLGDMGFNDVGRIRELLRTCNGDIAQVIPLLAESAGHTPEKSQAAGAPSTARDESGRRGERKSKGGEASGGYARGQDGEASCEAGGGEASEASGQASDQASARHAGTSCTLSHWGTDTSEQLPVVFDYTKPRSPEPQHTKTLEANMKDEIDATWTLEGDSAEEYINTARDGQSINLKRPRLAPRDEYFPSVPLRDILKQMEREEKEKSSSASDRGKDRDRNRHDGEQRGMTGQGATTRCKLVESRDCADVERRQQQGREVDARDAKVARKERQAGEARKERQAQASKAQPNKTQGHAWLLVHGVFLCRMHVLPICTREPWYQGARAATGSRDMSQWQDSVCVAGEWEIRLTSHVAQAQLCVPQVLCP